MAILAYVLAPGAGPGRVEFEEMIGRRLDVVITSCRQAL
jgi:hypothetical protein